MESKLSKIFSDEGVELAAALPLSRCEVLRPYKLERMGFPPKSVIMLAVPYSPPESPARIISKYAVPRDYHVFFKELFSRVIPRLCELFPGCSFHGAADDSPINETKAAALAGLGVIGDNGLLITEKYGSYVFLGEIFTDADLPDESREEIPGCRHCGRCKTACPSPDNCLSAITQKKGELTDDEIELMRRYRTAWGCDICQDVCPLNRGKSGTGLDWFQKEMIYAPKKGGDIESRAYGWRGRAVIERNLDIIYGGSFMTEEILQEVIAAAREAGKIMLSAENVSSGDITEKSGDANFVTRYDVEVQELLYDLLEKAIPGAVFIGEEGDSANDDINNGIAFIVDPIDGTTNFIFGARRSAVSIGISEGGEVTAGVVYDPYQDEMFYAIKGKGAFLNGKRIKVSDNPLKESVVLFGTSPYYRVLADIGWRMARALFDASLDMRRTGSAALDLCMVAAGRAGVFFEMKLSPWDYAASKIIIEEAGGKLTDISGLPVSLDKPSSVLAASASAYDEALKIAKSVKKVMFSC